MPEDFIRRNYFPVEVNFIDHDKFAALSWADRGKWLVVRALSERQSVRGTFTNRALLERLLTKEGDDTPEGTVSTLLYHRLLDLDDDGVLRIHDRDDWAASSTHRVREHRERLRNERNVDNPVDTVENVPGTFQNGEERSRNAAEQVKQNETFRETGGTNEIRGDKRRGDKEPLPLHEGVTRDRRNPRAKGTNPRAIAARMREAKKRQRNAIHLDYLAGKLTEAEEAEAYRRLDSDRPQA